MHEYAKRPAIADDMVQRHEQAMLLLTQPQYTTTQKRPRAKSKGRRLSSCTSRCASPSRSASGTARRSLHRQGHVHSGSNDLHQLPIDGSKGSPQDFMASE